MRFLHRLGFLRGRIELIAQLGEAGLGAAQFAQDALAFVGAEGGVEIGAVVFGAAGQKGDLMKIVGKGFGRAHRRRRAMLGVEAFEEEQGIVEKSLPRRGARFAPGVVEPSDLTAGEAVIGCAVGQA